MSALSNIPSQTTLMTLAARKSFSFTVQFVDSNEVPLSLDGAQISFTIGQQSYSDTPILTKQMASIIYQAALVRFDLQASELDLTPGIYPFEIVAIVEGYSSISLSGELEIVPSYEVGSVGQQYAEAPSSFGLVARVKQNRLVVSSNSLMLKGPQGDKGDPGRDGNPFDDVLITYDGEGRIATLTIDGQTTSYTYNPDDTIAFDQRDGRTRQYVYTDGVLTSIELQEI